jgi:hypothetical protein
VVDEWGAREGREMGDAPGYEVLVGSVPLEEIGLRDSLEEIGFSKRGGRVGVGWKLAAGI